jgi:hypothetical protein
MMVPLTARVSASRSQRHQGLRNCMIFKTRILSEGKMAEAIREGRHYMGQSKL